MANYMDCDIFIFALFRLCVSRYYTFIRAIAPFFVLCLSYLDITHFISRQYFFELCVLRLHLRLALASLGRFYLHFMSLIALLCLISVISPLRFALLRFCSQDKAYIRDINRFSFAIYAFICVTHSISH